MTKRSTIATVVALFSLIDRRWPLLANCVEKLKNFRAPKIAQM